MVFCSEYYGQKAQNLHERERDIKAARGKILDANGMVLATNKSVCTISVIHSQIEDEGGSRKSIGKRTWTVGGGGAKKSGKGKAPSNV